MSDRRRRSKNSIFYNPSTLSTTKSTTASASNQKIQVACRTRPLSSKERGERNVISSPSPQVVNITDPSVYRIVDSKHDSRLRLSDWTRTFRFDYVFSEDDTQLDIMNKIGVPMITNALQGYNTTLFAYGQTGSGKTYTMLGHFSDQLGLVPRMCDALFRRRRPRSSSAFSVEISFMEIYNERVRDLLTSSSSSSSNLRVREHPRQGVYVEDLSSFAVSSYDEVMKLLSRGSLARTTSSTQMNSRSSRSHAIFQIKLRMRLRNESRTSTVSLVDLAGSERSRTITSRDRERDRLQQRETSSINKSLSTLGDVINALCASRRRDGVHIPYRNATLTHLLKESLGGNSLTIILAAVSPNASNYEETLSTLKYVCRAKNILNRAEVNTSTDERIVSYLQEEIKQLRNQLNKSHRLDEENARLREAVREREKLIAQLMMPWDERRERTLETLVSMEYVANSRDSSTSPKRRKDRDRVRDIEAMLAINNSSNSTSNDNSNNMSYVLIDAKTKEEHMLRIPQTRVGTKNADVPQHIILESAEDILPEHCVFVVESNRVTVFSAPDAFVFVDGTKITDSLEPTPLSHGMMITFGSSYVFEFVVRDVNTSPSPSSSRQEQPKDDTKTTTITTDEADNDKNDDDVELLRSSYESLQIRFRNMSQKHAATIARSNLSRSRESDVARHLREELSELRENENELMLKKERELNQKLSEALSERDAALLEMKDHRREGLDVQRQQYKTNLMNEFEIREKTMQGEMSVLTDKLDRFVGEIEQMQVSEARLQEKNLRLECMIAAAQEKSSGSDIREEEHDDDDDE